MVDCQRKQFMAQKVFADYEVGGRFARQLRAQPLDNVGGPTPTWTQVAAKLARFDWDLWGLK